jgi:hypothetical protein
MVPSPTKIFSGIEMYLGSVRYPGGADIADPVQSLLG